MVRIFWSLVGAVPGRNSPQTVTKLTMKTTTGPLRIRGRHTIRSVDQWSAPSIRAASVGSRSTSWSTARMMRTPIVRLSVM